MFKFLFPSKDRIINGHSAFQNFFIYLMIGAFVIGWLYLSYKKLH